MPDSFTCHQSDHKMTGTFNVDRPHYLIVDDEAANRNLLKTFLAGRAEIVLACDGKEALEKMHGHSFDAIICDVDMPFLNGIDFFKHVHANDPEISKKILFCTGSYSHELNVLHTEHRVRYLLKPIQFIELQSELARINPLPVNL